MISRAVRRFAVPLAWSTFGLVAGCALGGTSTWPIDAPPLRQAADAPEAFSMSPAEAVAPPRDAGQACRNPMYDPRDGTPLVLEAALEGRFGDYAVPRGRYGVRERELLRLDCGTGRPIGVVPGSG
jgi:hypothetical protein